MSIQRTVILALASVLVGGSVFSLAGCGASSASPGGGNAPPPEDAGARLPDGSNDGSISRGDGSMVSPDGSTGAPDASPGTEAGGCSTDPTPFPCMPNSVFNHALRTTPTVASNSEAIFAYYAANWAFDYAGAPVWDKGIQLAPDPTEIQYDGNLSAVYFASTSDPVYKVKCFADGCADGGAPIDGVEIHIPTGAKWQGYPDCADAGANQNARGSCGDDHLVVISPDRTTEYDLYEAFGCFQNGSTCLIGAGGIVPFATSTGFSTMGGSNATNWALTQGLVLASEIMAGVIQHAFALVLPCSDGTEIAPGTGYGIYACPTTTNALAIGQRIFLDATDAQIDSWGTSGVTVPGQIVLKALAHYGAYYVDNLGYGGFNFELINENSYLSPGTLSDGWPAVAAKYSLTKTGFAGGYDLGVENVPGGISTWLKACAKGGC
jgi:hypothetical protein